MPKAKKQTVSKAVKANRSAEADLPREPVQIRLLPEVIQALDEIAKKNGITRAAVISIACARLIEAGL